MTAASRASIVVGFPGAGPTCSAVTIDSEQFQGEVAASRDSQRHSANGTMSALYAAFGMS